MSSEVNEILRYRVISQNREVLEYTLMSGVQN